MHIKDHSAAMKFFRTYDNVASKGKWKEFVDEMKFDSMIQEPRITAQGGGIIGKPGGLVEPGVMYYAKKVKRPKDDPFTEAEKKKQGRKKVLKKSAGPHKKFQVELHTSELKKWYKKNYDIPWEKQKSKSRVLDRYYLELERPPPPEGYITTQDYAKKYDLKTYPATATRSESNYLADLFAKKTEAKTYKPTKKQIDFFTKELDAKTFQVYRPYKGRPGGSVGPVVYVKDKGKGHANNVIKNYINAPTLYDHTIKNINNFLKKDDIRKLFKSGDYDAIKKALLKTDMGGRARANLMIRIAQAMSGATFRNFKPDIELNKIAANRIYKGLEKEPWFSIESNAFTDVKRDAIMRNIGDDYFTTTYETMIKNARKNIQEALHMDKEAFQALDMDVNELTGLTNAYKKQTMSSSQFINFMDANLNQKAHARLMKGYGDHEAKLQRALKGENPSEARQVIRDWKTWKDNWFHGKGGFKGLDKKYRTKAIQDILPDFILGDDASKIYTKKRLEEFQKLNFPIAEEIKNFGYAKAVGDTKKARSAIPLLSEVAGGNKKALDFITKALAKHKVPIDQRGFIATAMLEDFGKMGLKGGRFLKMLELQYEPLFEGLVYGYYKKYKGYDHSLAREELFLPKMIAKAFPNLWKKLGYKPFKTGFLEGADPLIEKDLYEIKGTEKENLGKVIGERSQVKKYIDAQKAYQKEVDKYYKLGFELQGMQNQWQPASPEKIAAKKKELADQEELLRSLEPTLKPGTPAYEAYMRAKEKEDHKFGMGKFESKAESAKRKEKRLHDEYLEYKGGKDRSFYLPKGKLKDRVEDPLFKTPYTFLETDMTVPDMINPSQEDWEYYGLTDTQVGPVIKEGIKDKWEQIYDMGGIDLMDRIGIGGGVANMAEGGIMSLKKK